MKIPFATVEHHTYKNEAFTKIIQDACKFFEETPLIELSDAFNFTGAGVYGLYYKGMYEHYVALTSLNKLKLRVPIYIGKAVPGGWRQSRKSSDNETHKKELCSRISQHKGSIKVARNIDVGDFFFRFMIMESDSSDMIGTIEAALIKRFRPVWNSCVDGFGNHDPGSGRYEQAKSDWDVLHPGRPWSEKCNGKSNSVDVIINNIINHFKN